MSIILNIIKLSAEELVLEPYIPVTNLKVEKSKLKKTSLPTAHPELKELFSKWEKQPYPMVENVDFTYKPSAYKTHNATPSHCIIFSGKSCVLRALFAIDLNCLNNEQLTDPNTNTKDWCMKMRYVLASDLSEKECRVSELIFVNQINEDFYNFIKQQLFEQQTQSHCAEQSIILGLAQQIKSIDLMQDDLSLNCPKYLMAYACVYVAAEKHKQLIEHFSSTKDFRMLYDISKKYEELINNIRQHSALVQKTSLQTLLNIYDNVVINYDIYKPLYSTSNTEFNQAKPMLTDLHLHHKKNSNSQVICNQHTSLRVFLSQLKNRELEIARRVEERSWFQDLHKNQEKLQIIQNIFFLYDKLLNADEIIQFIMKNKNVLNQSTSTLPVFFRANVKTATLIANYEPYLS